MNNLLNDHMSVRRKHNKSNLPLIKKEHLDILYGLILGDLYISRHKNENARMKFEQGMIHEEYLTHLFNIFKYLCTESTDIKVTKRNTRVVETISVYFVTRRLVAITDLHNLFYPDGVKIVPKNIINLLTPKSLAYWVMDDGNNHESGFVLNTTGFTQQDVNILQRAMLNNWGIETSLHCENKIYIKSKSKKIFIGLIKPYLHSSMMYKIKDKPKNKQVKS